MATHQRDRFDDVPDDLLRTGAHRAPARKGRGWILFAWAALATGVLVVIGFVGIQLINGKLDVHFGAAPAVSDTPTSSPSATVAAKIDPSLPITILNGTPTTGLANNAGDDLVRQGWTGASKTAGYRGDASTHDIKQTVVYYSDAANEAAARAMVLSLKIGTIALSDAYPESPITVVLGSDYTLPPQ